jgi:chromosome segregation ATPase
MDIERTMQFILEQQAAHAAAIGEHDQVLKEHREAMREQREALREHREALGEQREALGEQREAMREQQEALREQQQVIRQTQDLLSETIRTLSVVGEAAFDGIERLTRVQAEAERRSQALHEDVKTIHDDVNLLFKVVDGLVRHRAENTGGPNSPSV